LLFPISKEKKRWSIRGHNTGRNQGFLGGHISTANPYGGVNMTIRGLREGGESMLPCARGILSLLHFFEGKRGSSKAHRLRY